MATQLLKSVAIFITSTATKNRPHLLRRKTTSSQYVAARARDATFEKLMDSYKNLLKVLSIHDLILANPRNAAVSLPFLSRLSQKLHLNRGAASFLRRYPHIFHLFHDPKTAQILCRLTPSALQIAQQESKAINDDLPIVVDRLVRLLTMSVSKTLPLRAVFKVWREMGFPDDFEDSVISKNSNLFRVFDNAQEPGTHLVKLVCDNGKNGVFMSSCFSSAVEKWRVEECCKEGVDLEESKFSFRHGFPPGMRLSKVFKAKVREWQRLPYVGPYDKVSVSELKKRSDNGCVMALEKRAVGMVHEFLSLSVEKMVEVEKISHFKKWFGIEFNIRDLFLDHPGIFYLSTKGKTHTVFLREAYERGCLVCPNPVYDARRKLLDFVRIGRRSLVNGESKTKDVEGTELLAENNDSS